MLYQMAPGFHQSLLQAGQRPVGDPCRQRQLPPRITEVLGDHAQPQPHLVGTEAVARKPRHCDRLLALFDPLLRRAALVVEAHHGPVIGCQTGHDEPDPREQLPEVALDLRHHPPLVLPTGRLIKKALVADRRLV